MAPRRRQVQRKEESDEDMAAPNLDPPSPQGNISDIDEAGPIEAAVEPFDPTTFEHATLSAAVHTRMKAVTESWDIPKEYLRFLVSVVLESGTAMAGAKESKDPEVLKELEKTMRQVADMEYMIAARKDAAMSLRQDLTQGARISNPAKRWESKVTASSEEYGRKTSRQKYIGNDSYEQFRRELYQMEHEEPLRSLKSAIPAEEGDESDDDEIEVGVATISLRDPLTKTWLENPVTSPTGKFANTTTPKRSFSNTSKVTPVKSVQKVDAIKHISRADLEDDPHIERQVRNAKRAEMERRLEGRTQKGTLVIDSDDEVVE